MDTPKISKGELVHKAGKGLGIVVEHYKEEEYGKPLCKVEWQSVEHRATIEHATDLVVVSQDREIER